MAKTTKQAAKRVVSEAASSGVLSSDDVIMSLRLEGPMHERLRRLAFDRRSSMRDFIVRGIEQVLKEEKY